jgi:hypothetical protein
MSGSEHLILFALAYVLTGIALVGYDLSAPLLEKKAYVRQKNIKVAVITWFVWPATAFFEALEERRMRRRYIRFAVGVVLVAGAMYLWAQVAYLVALWLIGISWLAFVVTAIAMLFACPAITGIAMPPHPRPGSN